MSFFFDNLKKKILFPHLNKNLFEERNEETSSSSSSSPSFSRKENEEMRNLGKMTQINNLTKKVYFNNNNNNGGTKDKKTERILNDEKERKEREKEEERQENKEKRKIKKRKEKPLNERLLSLGLLPILFIIFLNFCSPYRSLVSFSCFSSSSSSSCSSSSISSRSIVNGILPSISSSIVDTSLCRPYAANAFIQLAAAQPLHDVNNYNNNNNKGNDLSSSLGGSISPPPSPILNGLCSMPNLNPCAPEAKCHPSVPIVGDAICVCPSGFDGDGRKAEKGGTGCINIDECRSNKHNCDLRSQNCIDTYGGFKCECKEGYIIAPNGKTCLDVDECQQRHLNTCPPETSVCKNLEGSFQCDCINKFHIVDPITGKCRDMNECEDLEGAMNPCDQICIDKIDGANCACREGWYLGEDGKTCIDIDECAENKHTCDPSGKISVCVNTPGSYTCDCNHRYGYTTSSDNKTCVNLDECATSPNICGGPQACCKDLAPPQRYACVLPVQTGLMGAALGGNGGLGNSALGGNGGGFMGGNSGGIGGGVGGLIGSGGRPVASLLGGISGMGNTGPGGAAPPSLPIMPQDFPPGAFPQDLYAGSAASSSPTGGMYPPPSFNNRNIEYGGGGGGGNTGGATSPSYVPVLHQIGADCFEHNVEYFEEEEKKAMGDERNAGVYYNMLAPEVSGGFRGAYFDKVDSAASCQMLCQEADLCDFFSYNTKYKLCYFKAFLGRKSSSVGYISGPKICPEILASNDFPPGLMSLIAAGNGVPSLLGGGGGGGGGVGAAFFGRHLREEKIEGYSFVSNNTSLLFSSTDKKNATNSHIRSVERNLASSSSSSSSSPSFSSERAQGKGKEENNNNNKNEQANNAALQNTLFADTWMYSGMSASSLSDGSLSFSSSLSVAANPNASLLSDAEISNLCDGVEFVCAVANQLSPTEMYERLEGQLNLVRSSYRWAHSLFDSPLNAAQYALNGGEGENGGAHFNNNKKNLIKNADNRTKINNNNKMQKVAKKRRLQLLGGGIGSRLTNGFASRTAQCPPGFELSANLQRNNARLNALKNIQYILAGGGTNPDGTPTNVTPEALTEAVVKNTNTAANEFARWYAELTSVPGEMMSAAAGGPNVGNGGGGNGFSVPTANGNMLNPFISPGGGGLGNLGNGGGSLGGSGFGGLGGPAAGTLGGAQFGGVGAAAMAPLFSAGGAAAATGILAAGAERIRLGGGPGDSRFLDRSGKSRLMAYGLKDRF